MTSATSIPVHADTAYIRTTVDLLPLSLVYYPDTAFGPLPTATLDLTCTAGHYDTPELQAIVADLVAAGYTMPIALTRTTLFADCRMQYVFTIPDELLTRLLTLDPATEVYVALQAWEEATVDVIPTTAVPVSSLTLIPDTIILSAQHPSDTIHAIVTPADADNQTLTWSIIRGEDLISWDSVMHAVSMKTNTAGGTVEIVATTQDGTNLSDTATVIVPNTSLVSDITITASDTAGITHSPAVLSSTIRSLTFTAVVQPSYAADTTLTWAVLGDPAGLAVWDAVSRTLTVLPNGDGGELRVVASANDGSRVADTLTVTIFPTPVLATGIVVSPKSATLTAAEPSVSLVATITPADAKMQDATWSVVRGSDLITWDAATHTATMKTNTAGGTVEIVATTQDGTNLSDTAIILVPTDTASMRMWIEVEEGEVVNECYTLRSPDSIHVLPMFEPIFVHPRVLSYSIVQGKHLVMLDRDMSGGLMISTMPNNVGGEALLQGMAEVEGKTLMAYLTLRIEPESTDVDNILGVDVVPYRRLVMYNGVIYIERHTADGVEWYNLQGEKVK